MSSRRKRSVRRTAFAALAGSALACSVLPAAWGATTTVRDPVLGTALVEVGANGSNADSGALVAVSQGGCTRGWIAVGAGNPSGCEPYWHFPSADNDGEVVGVGLLGGSGQGPVAVSDTGEANGRCLAPVTILGCLIGTPPYGVGVSAAGDASGTVAVSGAGNATATDIAVAGGDADAPGGLAAVSATGDAHGALVNVAPLGDSGR